MVQFSTPLRFLLGAMLVSTILLLFSGIQLLKIEGVASHFLDVNDELTAVYSAVQYCAGRLVEGVQRSYHCDASPPSFSLPTSALPQSLHIAKVEDEV